MESLNEVLTIIDIYCQAIENHDIHIKEDMHIMKKIFQTCKYIELVIKKVEGEKKEVEFENQVNIWMQKKSKRTVYKCTDFKNACDKILELYLKQEKLSNEFVDEAIKVYTEHCGVVRLEANINRIMINSMQANAILQIFKNLEIDMSDIEDELEIASWENEIAKGEKTKIMSGLVDMFKEQQISKLIQMAYKSSSESSVNAMILEFFTIKLEDNHESLYSELKNVQRKVLLKLLNDNSKFQVSFIDATFFIGRTMKRDEEDNWVTDSGFSYDNLKNVISSLLDGPDELYESIRARINTAQVLDEIWKDVARDCIL